MPEGFFAPLTFNEGSEINLLAQQQMKKFIKDFGLLLVGGLIGAGLLWFAAPPQLVLDNPLGGASDPNRFQSGITTDRVNVASASSTTILSANSAREYALIVNTCADEVFVALEDTASKNYGFMLTGNGGSYEINPDNLWVGLISGIASTSQDYCKVTVTEK